MEVVAACANMGVCRYGNMAALRDGGVKVAFPFLPIIRSHGYDGRSAHRADWANDPLANGPKHPGLGNVQQTAKLARADERQVVSGAVKIDGHNVVIGVSTPDESDDPLHGFEGELAFREPDDRPPGERSLEVFLDVGQESLRPIVPALNPNSALDLDERPARKVGEVRTPAAAGVEQQFLVKGRTVCCSPEEGEPGFQAGRGSFVAESETRHPRAGESTQGP